MHRLLIAAAVSWLPLIPAFAQAPAQTPPPTTAELLQRGIYAQDTAGDLDGAIRTYRQIVDSHPSQRELAAQAQYRLGTALLQKGDASAASQEIQRLGWDFPDYKELIDSAKRANAPARPPVVFTTSNEGKTLKFDLAFDQQFQSVEGPAHGVAQRNSEFDFTRTTTVIGTVKQIQVINPVCWLVINPNGDPSQTVRVSLDSPAAVVRAGGITNNLHLGDLVTITGAPARDGSTIVQATSVSANGVVVFSRPAPQQ